MILWTIAKSKDFFFLFYLFILCQGIKDLKLRLKNILKKLYDPEKFINNFINCQNYNFIY